MEKMTRFKRYVRSTTVPGDAVYLSDEHLRQVRLEGRLIESMAPLLQGRHRREDIARELAGEFSAQRVRRALDTLLSAGHVIEADPETDDREAGYWELLGADGDQAARAIRDAVVELVTVGEVQADWVSEAAAEFGIKIGEGGSTALTLVLTDDYLRPELTAINARALEEGRPWLLVKPVGSVFWVGPVFEPGATACYECLRIRLANKHMLHSYLRQRRVLDEVLVSSIADVPSTVKVAARMAALEAAKWLAGIARPSAAAPMRELAQDRVISLDTITLKLDHHPVTRRPQCPACGDPDLQAARQRSPLELVSQPKATTADGGHRAKDPQQFLDSFQHLISPISGPVSNLTKVPLEVEGLHTYTAGQNFAMRMVNAADLRAGLRSSSAGKGISDLQARASALGEAIERYSGVFQGDEERIVNSYTGLGPDLAIDPNAVHLYSEQQFSDHLEWNTRRSHFHWVGEKMDPDVQLEWSPVWSLTEQRHKYLPTSSLYFTYMNRDLPFHAGANSNGCAAGTSLEDAILQGFFELVERDTVAMWWYHRLRMPRIDLDSFDDPYFTHWQERYRSLNRDTWVLEVTNDLGIPSVVAVSYRTDKPTQDILIALGCHFDIRIAIGRALSEMNQFLPAVIGMRSDGTGHYAFNDPDQLDWWTTATVDSQPYLLPSESHARTADDYPVAASDDLLSDVLRAQRIVESKGMEMLVLDQTRVDIGLPVVRVIVPGLRHFWPRYAPGRLFDVPVELGWLTHQTTENDLNPIAMFL